MKARITTVISLVGVLGAGSAAALVNTQVLQSTESKSNEQVTVGAVDDPATPALTPVPALTPTPIDASDSITKIQSSILSGTQAMYQIGDAGLVTLDASGSTLTVVSVTPNAGWTVVKAENYGPADIEVKLQSGSTLVEFKANLQLGVITTSVESKIIGDDGSGTTPDGGGTPGGGTVDDDDDDDGYEDDDDGEDDDASDDDSDGEDDEDGDDDHGDDDD